MITALDSSVILDVLIPGSAHAQASELTLRQAVSEGQIILGECVLAEIVPVLGSAAAAETMLGDWQAKFVPSSRESALLAGEYFSRYLLRGGTRSRVVADFLIGAHAQCQADRLLARDRGYLRDYFRDLKVIDPSTVWT